MNLKQTGNTLLFLGICIMMGSLIYMIANLSSADNFINKWATLMGIGIFSTLWGTITLMIKNKQQKSN